MRSVILNFAMKLFLAILALFILLSPSAYAQKYILKGGSVRLNTESFQSFEEVDKGSMLRQIGALRREYRKTQDPETKKKLDELVKKNKRLIQVRKSNRVHEEKIKEEKDQEELFKNALATYYSVRDNGRTMANGKEFRNENIVAAHSTLPIGTRVKIKSHVTGNEFTTTIQDNKSGKLENCPVVLSKTALVEKLFNNNWDILEEIQKTGTQVEITVLGEVVKKYTPPKSDAEKVLESKEPAKISNVIKTRREIIALRKEYEESKDPEILEKIKKLQEKSKRLSRVRRNQLRTENAELTAFQTGFATYYSYIFNGRRTANGETFSNEEMTAAHRTLPFDTKVRVYNPDTKTEIVVRINDRGPYSKQNRIIDLSKEGFARLYGGDWANLSRGIAPVELYIIP
jgi:rare lipoprotein A (peptidoglycan hydrolase)